MDPCCQTEPFLKHHGTLGDSLFKSPLRNNRKFSCLLHIRFPAASSKSLKLNPFLQSCTEFLCFASFGSADPSQQRQDKIIHRASELKPSLQFKLVWNAMLKYNKNPENSLACSPHLRQIGTYFQVERGVILINTLCIKNDPHTVGIWFQISINRMLLNCPEFTIW